ncbi:MAG: SH3 domain-containing protein [Rhodospirillales bacterium]|nr:SH3 domain-containing protein [Rhodospirillales bacterium]
MRFVLLTALLFFICAPVYAEEASKAFRATDLPLPRFVSLHSSEVYVRSGPGQKYPVQWIFKKSGLPVEIVLEYDIWRKIKDYDGHEGWVHKSLLSGNRAGFIHSEDNISIHKKPNEKSKILAYLEPEVLIEIDECTQGWCKVNASGYKGWMPQKFIWGVYETEEFD